MHADVSILNYVMGEHVGCRYGPVLEGIYTSIEERQKERQAAIRQQAAAGGSVADKVKQVHSSGACWGWLPCSLPWVIG